MHSENPLEKDWIRVVSTQKYEAAEATVLCVVNTAPKAAHCSTAYNSPEFSYNGTEVRSYDACRDVGPSDCSQKAHQA